MSQSTQPVFFAHGSTRNVAGSGTMTKSPAPSISAMPKPPPGVNTGQAVLCAVSLARSVVVMVTPLRINAGASAATTVLPRSTPCGSANAQRSISSLCFLIARTPASAARACSALHKTWRSTKFLEVGERRRGDIGPFLTSPCKGGVDASASRGRVGVCVGGGGGGRRARPPPPPPPGGGGGGARGGGGGGGPIRAGHGPLP